MTVHSGKNHDAGHAGTSPFAKLSAKLDYPLYIVTTAAVDDGERSGCLIGFATQCSIHPPRFLACISQKNHTFGVIQRASVVAVHVAEAKHGHLAELFGGETGDEIDKFSHTRWHEEHGVPVLDECERWFAGSIEHQVDFGDHVGFVLKPLVLEADGDEEQLMFQQAKDDIKAGHKP